MNEIKVAIIGFGGIARTHYNAYCELIGAGYPIRVVAVCEKNKERVYEKVEINLGTPYTPLAENIAVFDDVNELLQSVDFDMADICLPTFLHKDMAITMLKAGKYVLCEKPMALRSADCLEMVNAAQDTEKRLMISHCLRFDYRYQFLKKCVEENTFGALRHLTLERHCDYPGWAGDFKSMEKTGGCILDTHIHDIDIACWLLGNPREVSAVVHNDIPHCQLVNSRLFYDNCTVIADVAWDEAREIPFSAVFRAKFEKASVDCTGHRVLITPHEGHRYPANLQQNNGFAEEIRAFGELIFHPERKNTVNPAESSAKSVELIEALKSSAETNGHPIIF